MGEIGEVREGSWGGDFCGVRGGGGEGEGEGAVEVSGLYIRKGERVTWLWEKRYEVELGFVWGSCMDLSFSLVAGRMVWFRHRYWSSETGILVCVG